MANSTIDNLPASTAPIPRNTPIPGVIAGTTEKITIEDLTGEYELTGVLASADALTCGTIPVPAIPSASVPVGYYARIIRCDLKPEFGTTPYASGRTLVLKTGGTATKQQFGFASAFIATGSNTVMGQQQNAAAAGDIQLVEDEGVYFTTQDGLDETAGDSDFKWRIRYELVIKL